MEKSFIVKYTPSFINALLDERDALYKLDNDSKRVDEIQKEISTAIRKNFDQYAVDFILETWTRFGAAPNVIYDDNGLFAVTGDGYQKVVFGKERLEGTFTVFVEKKQWKKTIRQALKQFINS